MENKTLSFEERLSKVRKNAPQNYPQYLELGGKIPPQAIPVEEAVLGALMLEKNALTDVIDILRPDVFYKEEHQLIYKAILSLFQKSKPIDILTVTQELRQDGQLEIAGGPYYISALTDNVASSANIEFHSKLLLEKFMLRELIRISGIIQSKAFDDTTDVFDLLDESERELYNIVTGNLKSSYEPMSALISKTLLHIEQIAKNKEAHGLAGVPSGFRALDQMTTGWQASDLVIIASRPGMGKTSFVLSMARNAAVDFGKSIAIFSLEMSSVQLVNRLISAEALLDSRKLRNGELEDYEWTQLNTKIHKLSEAQIFIDDTPGINVFDLRARCRRLKAQYNINMVIIDYLQLMNAHQDGRKNQNREQEISTISRSLKGLAKELDVPVIALSQLSRATEQRGGSKRPILSDLRESGSIEQDADQVLFIFRPEYYEQTEDSQGEPVKDLAEIMLAKNRHGATGTAQLKFVSQFARFANWDDYQFNEESEGGVLIKPSRMNDEYEDSPF